MNASLGGDMEPKQYVIRNIGDFGQVPPRRLAACLKELRNCFKTHAALNELCDGELQPIHEFVWIDDGQHNITAVFQEKPNEPTDANACTGIGGQLAQQ